MKARSRASVAVVMGMIALLATAGAVVGFGTAHKLHVVARCLADTTIGAYSVVSRSVPIGSENETVTRTLRCPAGTGIISGGVSWWSTTPRPHPLMEGGYALSTSGPLPAMTGWRASVWSQEGADPAVLRFVALCRSA